MKQHNIKSINNIPQKFVVVDDEITKNVNDRESFILDLEVSRDLALFAANFDEAIEIIKNHSDIIIFFLDVCIPKTESLYNYQRTDNGIQGSDWGISLIPEINQQHKSADIVIYSCYKSESEIIDKASTYNNVVGFYGKTSGTIHRKQLYSNAIKNFQNSLAPLSDSTIEIPALEASVIADPLIVSEEFDYSSLDINVQHFLKDRAQKIRFLLKRTAQDTINIGKYIIEVRKLLPHGSYELWVRTELGSSGATAFRYMKAYERLSANGIDDISQLDIVPTALYKLIPDRIPDSALLEMKQLAESGTKIDVKMAEFLVTKHTQTEEELAEEGTLNNDVIQEQPQSRVRPADKPKSISTNSLQTSIKQKILQVIRRPERWELNQHLLLCTDPNSDKFKQVLPNKISLCLLFPPEENWQFDFGSNCSKMSFYSQYKDLDPELDLPLLLEMIIKTIELTTVETDAIVVCYIPHPKILRAIERLGCVAYIAEPNYQKCQELLLDYSN